MFLVDKTEPDDTNGIGIDFRVIELNLSRSVSLPRRRVAVSFVVGERVLRGLLVT